MLPLLVASAARCSREMSLVFAIEDVTWAVIKKLLLVKYLALEDQINEKKNAIVPCRLFS